MCSFGHELPRKPSWRLQTFVIRVRGPKNMFWGSALGTANEAQRAQSSKGSFPILNPGILFRNQTPWENSDRLLKRTMVEKNEKERGWSPPPAPPSRGAQQEEGGGHQAGAQAEAPQVLAPQLHSSMAGGRASRPRLIGRLDRGRNTPGLNDLSLLVRVFMGRV